MTLTPDEITQAVRAALAEDIGSGDATSLATIPESSQSTARMVAREPLVICGLPFAVEAFRQVDNRVETSLQTADGLHVARGATLLRVTGPTRALLGAERVALNFLQRLSGVATKTHQFVDAVHGLNTAILDTRKTTPGWRRFEKYAVACGGGTNHRTGLFDMVLIKDNHLAALRDATPNAIAAALARARAAFPALEVEVECDTLEQVREAAGAGAEFILLDNMTPAQLREAVRLVNGRALTEASGGVTLDTVRAIAETGVDRISVGAITHSARAVDIALDFDPQEL